MLDVIILIHMALRFQLVNFDNISAIKHLNTINDKKKQTGNPIRK